MLDLLPPAPSTIAEALFGPGAAAGIVPLRGPVDALRMRTIRNAVRLNMTRDRYEIGALRQLRWWRGDYRRWSRAGSFQAWLMWRAGRAVGYGIVRWDRGRWWVTGALVAGARRLGLGRALFAFLTGEAAARDLATRGRGEVWLEVRADNEPARRLYQSLGYVHEPYVHGPVPEVLTMVRRQEPSGRPANPGGDG